MIGCLPALAFLAVFVYATHATQATAFEWKPGFSLIWLSGNYTKLIAVGEMRETVWTVLTSGNWRSTQCRLNFVVCCWIHRRVVLFKRLSYCRWIWRTPVITSHFSHWRRRRRRQSHVRRVKYLNVSLWYDTNTTGAIANLYLYVHMIICQHCSVTSSYVI